MNTTTRENVAERTAITISSDVDRPTNQKGKRMRSNKTSPTRRNKSNRAQNSRNPSWLQENLDITRDRKPPLPKKGKGGLRLGNPRKHAHKQKLERLDLQAGVEYDYSYLIEDFTSLFQSICHAFKESISKQFIWQFEAVMLLVIDLVRATQLLDIVLAMIHFLKHYKHINLFSNEHLPNIKKLFSITSEQATGAELIQGLKDGLRDWSRVKNSPLVKKITQVIMYCTTVGLYTGPTSLNIMENVKRLQVEYDACNLNFTCDFVYYVLDLLQFVCDKSYTILYEGQSPKSMFVSSMEYDVWMDKAQDLITKSKHLSDPQAYGIDLHEYLSAVRQCQKVGMEIYKYSCQLEKGVRSYVRKVTHELHNIEMIMLSKESAQAMRQVPFAIALEGDSSVGKSKVAEIIHHYFAKLFDKPLTGCERYVLSATAKFWDGFSTDQWSLFLDDVGMWNHELNMLDESVMNVIRIVNNMPYMPDMAALEDKGKTPYKGELVVMTTNCPDMKFNEYFTYPFAAARRVPWHIRVRPKPGLNKGFMLDPSKCPLEHNAIPDSWSFAIYEPKPHKFGNKTAEGQQMMQAKLVPVAGCENLDIKQLLAFIKEKATAHREHQQAVVSHSQSLDIQLCEDCKLPVSMCACVQEQIGIEEVLAFGYVSRFIDHFLFRILDWCFILGISNSLTKYLEYRLAPKIKWRLKSLKERVKEQFYECTAQLRPTKHVAILCSCLVIILAAYKLFYKTKEQGANLKKWGEKYPDMNESENVWRTEDYVVTTFDSTPQSLSMKNYSEEEIERIFGRSCVYLRLHHDGKWKFCRLLNLVGQAFITPNHCIPKTDGLKCQIIRGVVQDNVGPQHTFMISESMLTRYPDRDVCLLQIPSVTNGKDIRSYFVKERALRDGPASYLMRHKNGTISSLHSRYAKQDKLHPLDCLRSTNPNVWKMKDVKTKDGDCGSMLWRKDDMGFRILGIHQSYQVNPFIANACSLVLTKEFIDTLPINSQVGVTEPQLGFADEDVPLGPIAPGSALRCLPHGTIDIYGKLRHVNRPRSQVRKTILCDDMLELGYPLLYGPPEMSSMKPWKINIAKQVQADTHANWDDLLLIKEQMLEEWLQIPDYFKQELKILDMDTAVNGQPGVRFVDAIPRQTSAGLPWCVSKRKLITEIPSEGGEERVEFNEEVMAKVQWRLDNYLQSRRTFPVFRASLKDEATSLKKMRIGKTRVFMGAPVDFTIVTRSLLLPFTRVLQMNKFLFESAPGTQAQCVEWHEIYEYLTQHNEDHMIFGDFSGFDVTMRSDFMRIAFDLIEEFHRACGATEEHCTMIRALSYDIIFPLVEFNGDLIQLNGKNPSGQPLTVIINGIVNCLYMRYCYLKLNPKREVKTFKDNVALITYGDDNGMGVTTDIPWFNHSSLTTVLSEIGVTYTMADKESHSRPYIHIDEADFLKRKWRYESDTQTYVCPLAEDSIIKSLMVGVKSSANISRLEHAAAIISSAQLEFFWHGRDVFETWNERFRNFIEKFELEDYMPRPLQHWDDLVLEYEDRSLKYLQEKNRITNYQLGIEEDDSTSVVECPICEAPKADVPFLVCVMCGLRGRCMTCGDVELAPLIVGPCQLEVCRECNYTFFFMEDTAFIDELSVALYRNFQDKMDPRAMLFDLLLQPSDDSEGEECATTF